MKILIMGLPGSGKTYLAKRMQPILKAAWYNADIVREMANDWDFSPEGRIRQSLRMKNLADFEKNQGRIVICDFVCPTRETKKNFNPDITVWMNTIKSGRYEDTNKMFEIPTEVDYEIIEMNDSNHEIISTKILENV
jgi:adenylylsulfate kinase